MRTQFSKLALAAGFGLALVFTFSCSSGDDVGGDGSSSSVTSVSSPSVVLVSSSSLESISSSSSVMPSSSSEVEKSSSSETPASSSYDGGSSCSGAEKPSSSSVSYQDGISSSSQTNVSSSSQIDMDGALIAEPIAASSNFEKPEILTSWTDGTKNYYVIYAGYIRNTFVSSIFGPEHYDGFHQVEVQMKEINTSTVTKSVTETVSNSIVVSNALKTNIGLEEAIKTSAKAGAGIDKIFSVEGSIENSIKINLGMEKSINTTKGITTTTSINDIKTYVESKETSRKMTFGLNGAPKGYYRYALYSVSDVYFVVSTSRNNQELLSWDVVACPRDEYLRHTDYSPNGRFDNSPIEGNKIVFAENFWKTLPQPENELQPEIKTETVKFTTVGSNHTYTLKGFPATIEVYALGAGGGGQGGHRYERFMSSHGSGVGGSGGGGAATYVRFSAEKLDTFKITVGKGGSGGAGYKDPIINFSKSGDPGTNGGNTSVNFGSTAIIAEGGSGGGGSGKALNYGSGGRASSKPEGDLLEWESNNGGNGTAGTENSSGIGTGGAAAKITKSGETFGGGLGAINSGIMAQEGGGGYGGYDYTQSGSDGGNGQVIIVVTYIEKDGGI